MNNITDLNIEQSRRDERHEQAANAPDIDGAKVMLSHATAALELLLNLLEQQIGSQAAIDLQDLEGNIGVRNGTFVATLNLVQQEVFRAVELLEGAR